MPSQSRQTHLVRGATAATIATFAALFSHVIAGGGMPGPLGIIVPLILSLMVCVLLAGRTLSLTRVSVSVTASQTLFHTLFVLGAPTASIQQHPSEWSHHHHHSPIPFLTAPDHTLTQVHADATMWVSHLIAAAVTVFFVYRGEKTIHHLHALAEQLITWVRHCLVIPKHPQTLWASPRVPVTEHAHEWSVLSQLHTSTLSRRGPPYYFGSQGHFSLTV